MKIKHLLLGFVIGLCVELVFSIPVPWLISRISWLWVDANFGLLVLSPIAVSILVLLYQLLARKPYKSATCGALVSMVVVVIVLAFLLGQNGGT